MRWRFFFKKPCSPMASHLALLSFLFFGYMCVVQFSIYKNGGLIFAVRLGFAEWGKGAKHSCFTMRGGWWNEDAMECRDRERMQVATARNGMHRNGRSDRKQIWFPLTECLGYVLPGKCVTEWNEQNNVGAWSGLCRCIEGLAIFCILIQHKK